MAENESSVVIDNELSNNVAEQIDRISSRNIEETASKIRRNFSFSSHPTLEDIRQLQANFSEERNWDQYHQPRNLLLALVGEVGELAELFQWRGEVKEGLPDWTPDDKEHLGQELGDVLIYLVRLADKCQIDLPKAAQEKIKLNKLKYPTQQVWGSSKKYTDYR